MIQIQWEPNFPTDLRGIVEPYLVRRMELLPTWVQEFIVRYDPAQDVRMAVKVDYPGRWAVLIVTGRWFDDSDAERDNSIRHELVHVLMEPISKAIARIIQDTIPKDTPLYELADSTYTDGLEASVEDIARAIGRVT